MVSSSAQGGAHCGAAEGVPLCSPGGWDSEVPATFHLHPTASTSPHPLPVPRPEEAQGFPVVQQVSEQLSLSFCSWALVLRTASPHT